MSGTGKADSSIEVDNPKKHKFESKTGKFYNLTKNRIFSFTTFFEEKFKFAQQPSIRRAFQFFSLEPRANIYSTNRVMIGSGHLERYETFKIF